MNKKSYLSLMFAFGVTLVASAAVTEYRWIGGAHGDWGDGANWDQGKKPALTSDSHVVFDCNTDVTVVFTNDNDRIGKISFLSGNTTIESPKSTRTLYMQGSPFVIDVAAGASGTISNVSFYTYSGDVCRKTGAGTFTCVGNHFDNGGSRTLAVEAGVFRKLKGGNFNSKGITVKCGAELVYGGSVNVTKSVPWTLEEGALVTLQAGANAAAAGIQGKGNIVVEQAAGISAGVFYLGVPKTTEPFYGTVSGGPIVAELSESCTNGTANNFIIYASNQWQTASFRRPAGLGFAAGIGTFHIGSVNGYYGMGTGMVRLEDTAGQPITLVAGGYNFDGIGFSGSGSFISDGPNISVNASRYLAMGSLGAKSGEVSLQSDFDLSQTAVIAGLKGLGGSFILKSDTDVQVPLTGVLSKLQLEGAAKSLSNVDVAVTNVLNLYSSNPMTMAGGTLVVDKIDQNAGIATYNVVAGGKVYATPVSNGYDAATSLNVPGFVSFPGSNGSASLKVTGGDIWFGGGWGNKHITLTGGRMHFKSNFTCSPNNVKPTFRFDGGEVVLETRGQSFEFEAMSDAYQNYICRGGFHLRVSRRADTSSTGVYFYNPILADPDLAAGTDGGITISDWAVYRFFKPIAMSGAFRLLDGVLYPRADQVTNGTAVAYGTGDFVMRNSLVDMTHDLDTGVSGTLRLATGAGSAIVFNGGSTFSMRNVNTKGYQTITASALRAGGKGSVLTLSELSGYADKIGAADGDRFLVSSLAATNFVRSVPVIIDDTSGNDPHFAKYTAENGFALIPDSEYKTTLAGVGENDIIMLGATTISEDTHVAAAKVPSWGWLSVGKNKTLTFGNGTDPAIILFKAGGGVSGSGTINFGTSEGILYPSYAREKKSYAHTVECKLAGSGGVSYVGADYNNVRRMAIASANVYTGGTRINGCIVYPRNAAAFSSGDVYVGPGQYRGGRVEFDTDLTLANPFHVGGWGWSATGAFLFDANVTLSGSVEFLDETRVNVTDGHVGRLTGTLSGDRLVAWSSEDNGTGILELSGVNAMTGGIEIVKTTLSVTSASSLGTNDILLDGGTLMVNNGATCAIANEIFGLGKIRLAQKNAVSFTNLKSQGDVGFALQLDKRKHVISSLKGFSSVVAQADRPVALQVLNDDSFAGSVPENVTIYFKGEEPPVAPTLFIIR